MDKSFISKDQWNHPCCVAIQTKKFNWVVLDSILLLSSYICEWIYVLSQIVHSAYEKGLTPSQIYLL